MCWSDKVNYESMYPKCERCGEHQLSVRERKYDGTICDDCYIQLSEQRGETYDDGNEETGQTGKPENNTH